jgi:hypothetical protein
MKKLEELTAGIVVPRMCPIRQIFPGESIEDVPAAVRKAVLEAGTLNRIKPGQSVALTAGSRGIASGPLIYREMVMLIKSRGAIPFIVPAMGGHGGATSEGQLAMLRHLGITEEFCGCPIRSSMNTVCLGHTEKNGIPVYVDALAAAADAVVLVNRIKPHTSFRGPVESGLVKMTAIGLGKGKGADQCHSMGMGSMSENICEIASFIYNKLPVAFGLGILENAHKGVEQVVCLPTEDILEREPALLSRAFELMPQIYFRSYDVLVLDEIGKNISGPGMDCNVISRYTVESMPPDKRQEVVVVLDLTEESHGNAHGMGLADIATKRFFNKIDFESTYINSLTALSMHASPMPMILESDKMAIQAAIKFCPGSDRTNPKIIRARNTMNLEQIYISEALLPEARKLSGIEILGEPEYMPFDEKGNLF